MRSRRQHLYILFISSKLQLPVFFFQNGPAQPINNIITVKVKVEYIFVMKYYLVLLLIFKAHGSLLSRNKLNRIVYFPPGQTTVVILVERRMINGRSLSKYFYFTFSTHSEAELNTFRANFTSFVGFKILLQYFMAVAQAYTLLFS